jgi:hypothetical protein
MAPSKSQCAQVTSPALTQLEQIEIVMNSPPGSASNQNSLASPSPKRKRDVETAMAKDEPLSKKAAVEKLAHLSPTERRCLIDRWIELGRIPVTRNHMLKILRKVKNGKPISEIWYEGGRLPLMTDDEVIAGCSNIHEEKGRAAGREDVKKMLESHMKQKQEQQGFMVNQCSVSTNSVTRYHLLLGKLDPHASMQKSTVKKRYKIHSREFRNECPSLCSGHHVHPLYPW